MFIFSNFLFKILLYFL